MPLEWTSEQRIEAIQIAISRLHHDQTPIGLGFKLNHNPQVCLRCRAEISLLEISTIVGTLEGFLESREVETVDS